MILGSECEQLTQWLRPQSHGANPWLQSRDDAPIVPVDLIYYCFGAFLKISYFPFKTEIRSLKNQ